MEERRCWVDSIKSRCATCAPIRAACRRIVVLYGIAIISFATCRQEGEGGGYDTRTLILGTPSAEYDLPTALHHTVRTAAWIHKSPATRVTYHYITIRSPF